MVMAGSVVTKDLNVYAIVCGNTAKCEDWVDECGRRLTHGMHV